MDGLYLYLATSGLKSWRFDYRFEGKRQTMTFGTYPMVSLKEAREKLLEAKKTIKSGVNPSIQKKAAKESQAACSLGSFEVIAREWFENKKIIIKDNYSSRIMGRLEKDLFPFLSDRPISEITAPELLAVLRKMEARGAVDTAHRCLQYCGQIFRYAIATGRATHDISADLRGALKPAIHGHMASLANPKDIAGLMVAIDSYPAGVIQSTLKMAPYVS
jgi:integrase